MDQSLKVLFKNAEDIIKANEEKLNKLRDVSSKLDSNLRELGERCDVPSILILGPRRSTAKGILFPDYAASDGVIPLKLDTKYYTANILVHVSDNVPLNLDDYHGVILALDDEFHLQLADHAFAGESEIRICLCDDPRTKDYCVDQGVEWIEWSDTRRVFEAVSSSTWPNMVLKERPNPVPKQTNILPSKSVPKALQRNEQEDLENFEKLLHRAQEIRESAATLTDEERRHRAAQAAEEMIKLLGLEESSDEEH